MVVLEFILGAVLVIDCLLLILLVLVQLPKKEAGAGLAFGGAATDALFGSGSGNALTKITKYVATFFFVTTLALTIVHSRAYNKRGGAALEAELLKSRTQTGPAASTPVVPKTTTPVAPVVTSNAFQTSVTSLSNAAPALTNKVAVPAATNAPAK